MRRAVAKRRVIIVVIAVLLLAGGFAVLHLAQANKPGGEQAADSYQSQRRTFELTVADGRLTGGDSTLRVRQGDTVTLKITADTVDELHLHGYDTTLELDPGKVAELTFAADRAGRFEAELHHEEATIFALEVQPR